MEAPKAPGTLPWWRDVCIVNQGDLLSAYRAYVRWCHVYVSKWVSAGGDDVAEIMGMKIISVIFLAKRLHDTFNFAQQSDQAKGRDQRCVVTLRTKLSFVFIRLYSANDAIATHFCALWCGL